MQAREVDLIVFTVPDFSAGATDIDCYHRRAHAQKALL